MLKSGELEYLFGDCKPVMVCTTGELLPNLSLNDCPGLKQVLVCEGNPQGHPTLVRWMESAADTGPIVPMDPGDPAAILYTSGTKGFPKGATLSHGNVVSNIWTAVHHAGFTAEDRMILFLPLFHVFGQNFEIRIFDEQDKELPVGQRGVIGIRGPGVMTGYWNKPEETQKVLRGGWLHSGDIGMVDRVKDMINVSGLKVWPAEVEQFLYGHPAIREVAVYGVPHGEKGEIVKAAVVLKEGAVVAGDEIIAHCRERVAVYKVPIAVDILDELPKSATGKILKWILRETSAGE